MSQPQSLLPTLHLPTPLRYIGSSATSPPPHSVPSGCRVSTAILRTSLCSNAVLFQSQSHEIRAFLTLGGEGVFRLTTPRPGSSSQFTSHLNSHLEPTTEIHPKFTASKEKSWITEGYSTLVLNDCLLPPLFCLWLWVMRGEAARHTYRPASSLCLLPRLPTGCGKLIRVNIDHKQHGETTLHYSSITDFSKGNLLCLFQKGPALQPPSLLPFGVKKVSNFLIINLHVGYFDFKALLFTLLFLGPLEESTAESGD